MSEQVKPAAEQVNPLLKLGLEFGPLAIFFSHSAGPVMWALVPAESTATVTGLSTTSNS